MNRILLDTNAYSHLLKGDANVYKAISLANEVILSVVVIGELMAGFKGGKMEEKNNKLLENFIQRTTVTIRNVTPSTSAVFASVKTQFKIAGRPIPINDVWIAAHAIETDALLVTYDGHFKLVNGLKTWNSV